LSVMWFPTL